MVIKVAGVEFKNPVILASGPSGNGKELCKYINLNRLGGFTTKTITLDERIGNPPPRIVNVKAGIINSIGLQNPGIDNFIKEDLPFLESLNTNIILSIGGDEIKDYVKLIEKLNDSKAVFFELNLSCPNISRKEDFETNPDTIYELVKQVKKISKKPVFVKLGNGAFFGKIVTSAIKAGVDGFTLINSLKGLKIDINTKKIILKRGIGGYSGPAIKPIALAAIFETKKKFTNIPIIGMGGIFDYKDALEFIMAGANLVGIGSAVMADPDIPIDIVENLESYFEKENYHSILGCALEGISC